MNDYYRHKIILVTGAGSGIGKAISEALLLCGPARLILLDIHTEPIEEMQRLNPGMVEIHTVDVSSEEQMNSIFSDVIVRHGRLDILFNNAGIAAGGEFQNYTFELWNKLIDVNLRGVIYGSTFAYRQMIVQGSGHIINMASLGGLIPEPMASAYSAGKHAVVGLSTSLRDEASSLGVRISVACPGVIKTPIFDKAEYAGNVDREKVKEATLEHGAISPEKCAAIILRKVAKNKGIILVKPMDMFLWRIYRVSPRWLSPLNRLIAKYFRNNFRKS